MILPPFARDSTPLKKKRVVKLTPPRTGSPPGYVPSLENVPAGTPTGSNPPGVDYRSLIENDPWYQQAIGNLSAGGIQSAAERDAALRRAYAQFGENFDPSALAALGFGDPGFLDENTRNLAAENTKAGLSTSARLLSAHNDQANLIGNSLAARGAFNTGSTGFQLGREQQAYTGAQYDARSKLADYAAGVQAAFAASEQQRAAARQAAAQEAATRLGNGPPPVVPGVPRDPPGTAGVAGFPAAGGLAAAQGRAYGPTAPKRKPVARKPAPSTGLAFAQGAYYAARDPRWTDGRNLAQAQGAYYGRV